jgi:hypothetical protein
MHLVHNVLRTLRPPSYMLTVCKLGLKVLKVAFFDQGRLRPKDVFLPQLSHFAIITLPLQTFVIGSLIINKISSLQPVTDATRWHPG